MFISSRVNPLDPNAFDSDTKNPIVKKSKLVNTVTHVDGM